MAKSPRELNDEAKARAQAERDEERSAAMDGADMLRALNAQLDELGHVRQHDFCNDVDYVNDKDLAVVLKRGNPVKGFAAWTRDGRTLILRPLRDSKTSDGYEAHTHSVEEALTITIDLLNGTAPKRTPTKLGFLGR